MDLYPEGLLSEFLIPGFNFYSYSFKVDFVRLTLIYLPSALLSQIFNEYRFIIYSIRKYF